MGIDDDRPAPPPDDAQVERVAEALGPWCVNEAENAALAAIAAMHRPDEARVARLREALEKISKQELSADMSVDDQLDGDFEGAYNHLIEIARAALADDK